MADISIALKATLVLGLALFAVRLLRGTSASVRALLLSSAFAVVLVLPVATLVMPERTVEVPLTYASMPMDLLQDVPQWDEAPIVTAPAERSEQPRFAMPDASTILRSAWAIGTIVFAAPIVIGLFRLSRMRRRGLPWLEGRALVDGAAAQAGVGRRVDLFLHEDLAAPMTCGAMRPAIGLPIDAPSWSETELRQAMLHELEHVRRADWPVHLIARTVCALYWFHPLAWRSWRALCLESERACDDAVLRCAERTAYAEQLVSLARRVSARPAPLLSMAGRSDLSTRVHDVLDGTRARGRVGVARSLAIVALAGVLTAAIWPVRAVSQTNRSEAGLSPQAEAARPTPNDAPTRPAAQDSPEQPAAPTAPLAFEVASIRRNTTLSTGGGGGPRPGGRYIYTNMPARALIAISHRVPSDRVLGGPDWIVTERFDINATGKENATREEIEQMFRALLRDRFSLVAREETRELPVYHLVLARPDGPLGPGMRPSAVDCTDPEARKKAAAAAGPGDRMACGFGTEDGTFTGGGIDPSTLEIILASAAGRPVLDRTGLKGHYDIDLQWTPTLAAERRDADVVSIFTAVQEQLGLRLESGQATLNVIVVDRIERPTEN